MQIVSLTEAIAKHDLSSGPLVLVRDVVGHASEEGATEIFLYTRDQPRLFAASVIAIDQLGLSIHDARIHTSAGNLCFNSYIVLDESGHSISANAARCRHIERTLIAQLSDLERYPELAKRRIPRRLKQFQRPTEAHLSNDPEQQWSVLRVVASDRPGLLARLGIIFVELGINVHSAKITTLGERVEDVFYISGTWHAADQRPRSNRHRYAHYPRAPRPTTQRRNPRELSRMNPYLDSLLPYPFERMNALKAGVSSRSNAPHIALSIGEPKHAAAKFLVDAATDATFVRPGLGTYPATRGSDSLRSAIAAWATSRFRSDAGFAGVRQTHPAGERNARSAVFVRAVRAVRAQRQLRGIAESLLPDLRRGCTVARHDALLRTVH